MARIHVYADESRTQGERYMLIGGLWVPADAEPDLRTEIARLRSTANLTAELKWGKVSQGKLQAYRDFLDIFFRQQDTSFHCIVVDTMLLDHSVFSRSDAELGFYKFYFQLISRKLVAGNDYLVFTDQRHDRKANRLATLRICTNRWWAKHKIPGAEPVRALEARDSKREDLIQMADVLLGAVGYAWNQYDSSPARVTLINHIVSRLGLLSLRAPTPPSARKFNIWHWQPSAASRARQQKKRPGS
ncbi:MAG: DUF3800 domain-containing protein [Armatimonadetes bacterium]|nr:DUF3800 domain-containing protein [Armatimonadota bacterium]